MTFSKHKKNLLIFAILLGVIIIPSTLASLSSGAISKIITKLVESQGIKILFTDFNVHLLDGISFESARISKPDYTRFPEIKFNAGNFSVRNLFPPSLEARLNLYDSNLNCTQFPGKSLLQPIKESNVECTFNHLNLKKVPFFRPLGIKGDLSIESKLEFGSDKSIKSSTTDIQLSDGVINPTELIKSDLIKISTISDILLVGNLKSLNNDLELTNISLKSSHGSILANGKLSFMLNILDSSSVLLDITLSDLGFSELSPWAPLLLEGKSIQSKNFKIEIKSSAGKDPKISLLN